MYWKETYRFSTLNTTLAGLFRNNSLQNELLTLRCIVFSVDFVLLIEFETDKRYIVNVKLLCSIFKYLSINTN